MGDLTLSQLSSQFDLLSSFSIFLLMPLRAKKLTWFLKNAQGVILMEFFLKNKQTNKSRAGDALESAAFGGFGKNVGVDLGTCGFQSPAKGGCVGTQPR